MNREGLDVIAKTHPIDDPKKLQAQVARNPDLASKKDKDAIALYLFTVLDDAHCFGSAMWFLSTNAKSFKEPLASGSPPQSLRKHDWYQVNKAVHK